MRLKGGQPVTEVTFSSLVDRMLQHSRASKLILIFAALLELEDSISGSASSSDDDESDDSDAIAALVDKTRKLGRSPSPDEDRKSTLPQTPLAWFHSPPSTQIGVYKVLFPNALPTTLYLDELKGMQEPTPSGRTWAVFMTAGGHFAGAVVRVSRPATVDADSGATKKGKQKKPVPDIEVLKHKTFHRYTSKRSLTLEGVVDAHRHLST